MGDQLTLGDYLEIGRRRWKSIVLTVGIVVVLVAAVTSRIEPSYRASALVLVRSTAAQERLDPTSGSSNAQTLARRLENEVAFARSDDIEQAAAEAYGEPFEVTVRPESDSDTLVVSAVARDADDAARRANVYAEVLVTERTVSTADELVDATRTLNARIAEIVDERVRILAEIDDGEDERLFVGQLAALDSEEASLRSSLGEIQIASDLTQSGAAQVTEAAEAPGAPFEPNWIRNLGVAAVLGLLLGIGGAALRETLDGTIRSKLDLEEASGLPVLGVVPEPTGGRHSTRPAMWQSDVAGAYAESMRGLRSSVLFALAAEQGSDRRVVVVTSADAGEGKTTTIVNLAAAMARSGKRVVLLDCDLRRPRAAEACGLSGDLIGVSELLAGTAPLAVRAEEVTGEELFHVVAPGRQAPDPAELLTSRALASLIASLRERYELVLIDTAPILPVADTLSVAALADAVILVSMAERTKTKQVTAALEQLRRADSVPVGAVLTNADTAGEYGGYGYGYGYGYGRGRRRRNGVRS